MIFVIEAKLFACRLEHLKYSLSLYGCLAISCEGCHGSLGLFWHSETTLELLSYSKHYFDVMVIDEAFGCTWRITLVYGHAKVGRTCDVKIVETYLYLGL